MSVRDAMVENDVLPSTVLRHGAYVCLRGSDGWRRAVRGAPVDLLVRRLRLENEFDATNGHPGEAVAFLRRIDATAGQLADDAVGEAEVIVHVASPDADRVGEFCAEISALLGTAATIAVLQGEVRPPAFTGAAMHNFAYAHQVQQQPGRLMPHAFIVPMRKTGEWWEKTWMERHTYFLPRYDDAGRMVNEGHALAAAAGIPHLVRRTYKHRVVPAPAGAYDFVNYFECAEAEVPTFWSVCAALRDTTRNPEWKYVLEGPTWHGRRVRLWQELFD